MSVGFGLVMALCSATACDDGGTSSGGGDAGTGASSTASGQGGAPPPVESWFSTDFNDLNASADNLYDFANRYSQTVDFDGDGPMPPQQVWTPTHTEGQGWLGSPAPHVTVHGCEAGAPLCNTSEHQFSIGWTTPQVGDGAALGESVFIRFRIKFDPGSEFHFEKLGAKFILFGQTGVVPNSRWIIHLYPPRDNNGCTLGFDYSFMEDGFVPPESTWVEPSDWGWNDFADPSPYAGFNSSINIGWGCNAAVLVTGSDHPAPVPKPQNHGEAAVDGWTHLQFEAIPNPEEQTTFRTWANNNNQAMPSSERNQMPEALGITGWNGGVDVGGYWGIADQPDVGFIIDDFEIGPVFDPNWAQ